METRTYRHSTYRILQGKETQQITGHTREPATATAWYWEPADDEGDVLYSNAYTEAEEAARAAEDAYDAGDWE